MTLRELSRTAIGNLEQLKTSPRHRYPAAKKLRKDELEKAIVVFPAHRQGCIAHEAFTAADGVKDVERGLNLKAPIENYTSNHETKDCHRRTGHRMPPEVS